MTVDIATLAIRIDSLEARNAARDMDRMRDAGGRAEQATSGLETATRKLQGALALLGLGAGVGAIIRMADEYTKFTAQLRLATESQRQYATALEDVRRIANTAQQDLAATGVLYARIANGTRELGVTQKQVAAITETVNLALKVSGATAAESSSAMLQLSQSFASGTLRGEEFNAVNEAAPRLMKALADGIGVPVGALKKMAEEGAITSKIMADVLPNALLKLQEEAKQVQTISGAFTVLKNNIMEFAGVQAQASGTVSVLTTAIGALANNLTLLAGVTGTLVAVNLGNWLASLTVKTYERITAAYAQVAAENAARAATIAAAEADLARTTATGAQAAATKAAILIAREEAVTRLAQARSNMLAANAAIEAATAAGAQSFALRALRMATAELAVAETARIAMTAELALLGQQQARVSAQIAAATAAQTAAQSALNAANGAGVVSVGLLGRAIGFLGGPIGAIITVLGLAATAWMVWGNKGAEAEKKVTATLAEEIDEYIANLDKQIEKLKERNELASKKMTTGAEPVTEGEKKREAILAEINRISKDTDLNITTRTQVLAVWGGRLNTVTQDLERFNTEQKKSSDFTRNDRLAKWYGENGTSAQRLAAELEKLKKQFGEIPPEMEKMVRAKFADKGAAAAVKQEQTAYQQLMTTIEEKIAANKLEMNGYNQLSDSQKLTIKLDAEVSTGKTKLSKADIEHARTMIAVVATTDAVIASNKRAAEGLAEFTAMQKSLDDQVAKSIQSANDEATKNEQLVLTFGMTKAAIEQLELARLQDQLAQRASTGMTLDEIAALEQLIDAKKRNVAATGNLETLEANKKANDEMVADYKRTVDKYDDVFRTGFADMLNHGKSGWKSFTTSLLTTFKTTVADQIYKMLAQPFVVKIVGSLLGVTGAGAAQAAGGALGGGGASGTAGLLSAGKSIYEGFSSGFMSLAGTLGSGISTMGAAFGSEAIAAFGAGLQGGALGSATASAASGYGGTAAAGYGASAAPYIAGLAGVAGGIYGGRAISGEYGSNSTVNAGTAIGAVIGSVVPVVGTALGALVGGLLGGVANRLFGMGEKKVQSTMIEGSLTATGATGNNVTSWTQKGGLFRSNKSGIDNTALTGEQSAAFTTAYKGILDVSKVLGTVIGADTSALSDRVQKLSIDFKGLTTDAEKAGAITKFFEGVADTIALEMVPNLKSFQKEGESISVTMQRVVTDYASLDGILASIGTTFGSTGVSSIAAREGLIAAAGGLDKLASGASYFQQNFLTQAEQLAPVQKQLTDTMASLGLSSITTIDQFKAYTLSIDKTTEGGAKLFAQMLALAQPFKQITDATDALAKSTKEAADVVLAAAQEQAAALAEVNAGYQDQIDALLAARQGEVTVRALEVKGMDASTVALYDRLNALKAEEAATAAAAQAVKDSAESLMSNVDDAFTVLKRMVDKEKAIKQTAHEAEVKALDKRIEKETAAITKSKALADALSSALGSMKLSGTSEEDSSIVGRSQIQAALAIAKAGGPLPTADSLKEALTSLSNDSMDRFATYDAYLTDFYKTKNDLAALGQLTGDSVSVEQKTLDALNSQKDANQIAYDDEIAKLNEVVETAQTQIDVLKGMDTSLLTIDQSLQAVLSAILQAKANPIVNATAGIAKSYQEALGRAPDKAGMEYWQQQAAAGSSLGNIDSAIKGSGEAKIQAIYKNLLGRSADAGGLNYWLDALNAGASLSNIEAAIKADAEYQKLNKVPGYATGGDFAGGLRLVGENGPELEATGPSRIFSAGQTASMLRGSGGAGNNNAELIAELRAQRQENAQLSNQLREVVESHLYAIAKNTLNTADTLEAAAVGDVPLATKETA